MVFIPALTTFVISNMLGGGKVNLIGNIIEQEFTVNSNWYLGSGLSLVMMVFIIISMVLLEKFDKTGRERSYEEILWKSVHCNYHAVPVSPDTDADRAVVQRGEVHVGIYPVQPEVVWKCSTAS